VAIYQHGGYPELRVNGQPFFVHSAAFFYYRIPRDLWETALDRHRELGINTIDLYIPWSWHEPREGDLDFAGRTNPRRDLRALLRLITIKGLKVIARPGPVILNEWRHGGYPEWLLERPEYGMPLVDRLEGRYPPLAGLNARDAEAAAEGWLANATHVAAVRRWFAAVARELAPYSSRRLLCVPVPEHEREKRGAPEEKEIGGPLLFVQLDDDLAIGRTNRVGPSFWRYVEELRGMLEQAGLDLPFYFNPTDMRVSAAGAGLARPVGVMGQWYMPPPLAPDALQPRRLTPQDISTIEFFVETLKTQPHFPPMIIEYQAGWYTPGDDSHPTDSPMVNTLLSSRLLLAHGLKGLNYFPLQDSLYPAGYETPWTNRHYRWDAALAVSGERQPRAIAVQRNGQLLAMWGELLAASHKRADFGLVYPLGSYPQEALGRDDIQRAAQLVLKIQRVALLAGLAVELLDPHYQPADQLLRHPLVLLPVLDPHSAKFRLSETAQRVLVEYVRRGGILVYFPVRPAGAVLEELWKKGVPRSERPAPPESAISATWAFGQGQVKESSKDFYSWVEIAAPPAENRAAFEAAWAVQTLRGMMEQAGMRPAVKREASSPSGGWLVVTQLVSNAGTAPLGRRTGGRGLLSVTNLSYEEMVEETLDVLSPRRGSRDLGDTGLRLRVSVPPRESLLLPLGYSLCMEVPRGEKCDDEVVIGGAELLRAERDGHTLELTFYVPIRATVRLRLAAQPRRISLDEMRPHAEWAPRLRLLEFELLRGASPDFLRTVKIHLPYTPRVPRKPEPGKGARRDFSFAFVDSLRLPLGKDTVLPTYPPLLLLDANRQGRMTVQIHNYNDLGRDVDVKVEGPVRGSGGLGLDPGETRELRVNLRPARESVAAGNGGEPANGVLLAQAEIRSGRDRYTTPVALAVVGEEGTARYEFDFDRDGANEWVLENSGLRLIVSPEAGGRAIALVDKRSGANLTTSVGALRDHFAYAENPQTIRPERARGRYGMFNRPYRPQWVVEKGQPGLRLDYDAPDVYPAGAQVEKTVRLTAPNALAVDYVVELRGTDKKHPAEPAPQEKRPEQAFVSVHSVPVVLRSDRSTAFCWAIPAAASSPESQPDRGEPVEQTEHCERFSPEGAALAVPEGVTRLEVRTPGQLGLALSWTGAGMTVEMKQYSALLKLRFPPLEPGRGAGTYRIQFEVRPVP